MHLHTQGIESLYKYVPKKMLPSDLGGEFLSEEEATGNIIVNIHFLNFFY